LGAVSYSPSIVTVAIFCSFARYSDLLVENREIAIPHLYLAPPQGVTPSPSEYCHNVLYGKTAIKFWAKLNKNPDSFGDNCTRCVRGEVCCTSTTCLLVQIERTLNVALILGCFLSRSAMLQRDRRRVRLSVRHTLVNASKLTTVGLCGLYRQVARNCSFRHQLYIQGLRRTPCKSLKQDCGG